MHAQGLGHLLQPGRRLAEHTTHRGQRLRAAHQSGRGIHDDRFVRLGPHGQIGGRISRIGKAASPVSLNQEGNLACAFEIGRSIAPEHPLIEQPEMSRYGTGKTLMTGCGQHQLTPSPAFVGEKLDQSLVVGERASIERHTAGNFMLERGFAFQQPEGKLKDRERTLLQQRQQRFPQQIGPDERAIKIDTKRTFSLEILTHESHEGF